MRRVLITGGRAPVSLELARLFRKSGYEVYGADSTFASFLMASNTVKENFLLPSPRFQPERFQQALLKIINQREIDLLVPTCEEIFYISKLKHLLPSRCSVFADEFSLLNKLHNKWTFIKMVKRYGLLAPETKPLQTENGEISPEGFEFPVVIKPIYSRFGDKIAIIDNQEQLVAFNTSELSDPPRLIMQQYIHGNQICTYSIAMHGQLLAHTAYPTEYKWGRGSTLYFEHIEHVSSFNWVRSFVERIQFSGQIAFDFIEQGDGTLFVLECNPRTTSGLHLLRNEEAVSNCFQYRDHVLVEPQGTQRSMVALGMMVCALRSVRTKHDFIEWKIAFLKGRDVIWSVHDPVPALMQVIILGWFVVLSVVHKVSVTAATTRDIEYSE